MALDRYYARQDLRHAGQDLKASVRYLVYAVRDGNIQDPAELKAIAETMREMARKLDTTKRHITE